MRSRSVDLSDDDQQQAVDRVRSQMASKEGDYAERTTADSLFHGRLLALRSRVLAICECNQPLRCTQCIKRGVRRGRITRAARVGSKLFECLDDAIIEGLRRMKKSKTSNRQ